MMTKKHFTALAKALRANKASDALIADVAAICRADNPNFDCNRFEEAAQQDSLVPMELVTSLGGTPAK